MFKAMWKHLITPGKPTWPWALGIYTCYHIYLAAKDPEQARREAWAFRDRVVKRIETLTTDKKEEKRPEERKEK